MDNTIHPIADEIIADRAIELFLAGYDPLLYAADLGLTPETIFDQIRATLKIYIDKAVTAESKLVRKGKAGRKPLNGQPMTSTQRNQRRRKLAKS